MVKEGKQKVAQIERIKFKLKKKKTMTRTTNERERKGKESKDRLKSNLIGMRIQYGDQRKRPEFNLESMCNRTRRGTIRNQTDQTFPVFFFFGKCPEKQKLKNNWNGAKVMKGWKNSSPTSHLLDP